jgi:hypothetical protein
VDFGCAYNKAHKYLFANIFGRMKVWRTEETLETNNIFGEY